MLQKHTTLGKYIMTGQNPNSRDIPAILDKLKTTTQLLGLCVIVTEAILVILVFKLQGTAQILLIIGSLAILISVIVGAVYLARLDKLTGSLPTSSLEPSTSISYEVFLSAPMDALDSDQARALNQDNIGRIIQALQESCELDPVFCVATRLSRPDEYESDAIAQNYDKIRASRKFIMIYPERLPSSILVEAGMALAFQKDSVWFVQKGQQLPFLLRDAGRFFKS